MNTINSNAHALSTYGVLRRDLQTVAGDVAATAKSVVHGVTAGSSASVNAVGNGLTAVGDSIATVGRTINTYI
ncbi:MAG: hypothetical protein JO338_00190 [Aquitalea sp.]|nr:hypothetical protein [Aquitalea sp.]